MIKRRTALKAIGAGAAVCLLPISQVLASKPSLDFGVTEWFRPNLSGVRDLWFAVLYKKEPNNNDSWCWDHMVMSDKELELNPPHKHAALYERKLQQMIASVKHGTARFAELGIGEREIRKAAKDPVPIDKLPAWFRKKFRA